MAKDKNMRSRSQARLSAVQALYQMELAGQKSKLVVNEFNEYWFKTAQEEGRGEIDQDYFQLIVLGVVAEQAAIDAAIADKLNKKWSLPRLDITLRAILRCATFEILRHFDVPAIVVVNEYVAIAKGFFEDAESGFINAALDKIAREQRPAEFGLVHVIDE